jgi:hypothetical protein
LLWTLALVGWTLFVTLRTPRSLWIELMLLWILAYFLFYKHVWEHQYVMLLPVFALLFWRQAEGGIRRGIPTIFFWSVLTVIALPTGFLFIDRPDAFADPEFYWSTIESFIFHAPKPLAVVAMYVALSIMLLKSPRAITGPPQPSSS